MIRTPSSRSDASRWAISWWKEWRLRFVNAQLHDGNVSLWINVAEHRPSAMVETPAFVNSHRQRSQQLPNAMRQFQVTGRRILHVVMLSGKTSEVVDGFRPGAHADGGILDVPMRRQADDSFRTRQFRPNLSHASV